MIGHALWFCVSIFLGAQFGAQVNLPARGVERNLSSPNIKIHYRQKFLLSEIFEIFPNFTYFLENKNCENIHFFKIVKIKSAKQLIFFCFLLLNVLKNACLNTISSSNYGGNTNNNRIYMVYAFLFCFHNFI